MTILTCITLKAWRATAAACLIGVPVARAELGPGDVAIVAVNTDECDDFAWVALCDVPSNTVIRFTDSSVSNGWFRWTEHLGGMSPGPLEWSSTGTVAAGTVVRWDGLNFEWSVGQAGGVAPDLSASGDQLIAYTGSISSNAALTSPWLGDPGGAHLLCGVNIANSGWDNVAGGAAGTSFVPPGLSTNAGTALHLGARDDTCYIGLTRGTAGELRLRLADPANWVTSNDPYGGSQWPTAFDIVTDRRGTMVSIQ